MGPMGFAVLSTLDANLRADGLMVLTHPDSVPGSNDSLHVVFGIANCHRFDQPIRALASFPYPLAAHPRGLDNAFVSGVWRVGFLHLDNF